MKALVYHGPGSKSWGTSYTRMASWIKLQPHDGSPAFCWINTHFDNGGQNVGYYDTTSGNAGGAYRTTDVDIESSSLGGYDIGWIAAGGRQVTTVKNNVRRLLPQVCHHGLQRRQISVHVRDDGNAH